MAARSAYGVGKNSDKSFKVGKPRRPGKKKSWITSKGKTSKSGNGKKLRF